MLCFDNNFVSRNYYFPTTYRIFPTNGDSFIVYAEAMANAYVSTDKFRLHLIYMKVINVF